MPQMSSLHTRGRRGDRHKHLDIYEYRQAKAQLKKAVLEHYRYVQWPYQMRQERPDICLLSED